MCGCVGTFAGDAPSQAGWRMIRYLCALCLALMSLIPPSFALEVQGLGALPVMHEGRVKPIDSFARAMTKRLSGSDRQAMDVLVEVLFNPAFAENLPLIKISDRDVLGVLNLPKRADKLFSYREVDAALKAKRAVLLSIMQTPEESWSSAQTNLIMLQSNKIFLGDVLSGLSLFLPLSVRLDDGVPDGLRAYAGRQVSYYDALRFQEELNTARDQIVNEKGRVLERYSMAEQSLMQLAFTLDSLRASGQDSRIFSVIPPSAASDQGAGWLSPWQIVTQGLGGPDNADIFQYWNGLAKAFHAKDQQAWHKNMQALHMAMARVQAGHGISTQIELWYNRIHPFTLSLVFYLLCLAFVLVGSLGWARLGAMAPYALFAGVALHGLGIIARMMILQRPPVSTLYESIIFVGLITALYGCLSRQRIALIIAALCAAFLHLVALSHDQDGDSMMMLSAVLNTNFWLATHVLCITAGYGFCLITSALAHVQLYRQSKNSDAGGGLHAVMHRAALWSLLLTGVGTVLGGIWADQSWGRFWGWDPKENGALLIVLWLVWALHGRISGAMKGVGFAAALAYLSVIVMLSWFGVNLLNVGLHAYGFTDKAAWFLVVFVVVETLLIAALYAQARRNGAGASGPQKDVNRNTNKKVDA